jgi:hypothetical protein
VKCKTSNCDAEGREFYDGYCRDCFEELASIKPGFEKAAIRRMKKKRIFDESE